MITIDATLKSYFAVYKMLVYYVGGNRSLPEVLPWRNLIGPRGEISWMLKKMKNDDMNHPG